MMTFVLFKIFLLLSVLNTIKSESGYDTLDPWAEPTFTLQSSNYDDDFINLGHVPEKIETQKHSGACDEILAYYRRLINLVFKRRTFKKAHGEDDNLVRNIYLKMSNEQFNRVLVNLETVEDLRKVDGVISEIFLDSDSGLSEQAFEMIEGWFQSLTMFAQKPFGKIILLLSAFLCTFIYLRYISSLSSLKISLFLLLIISFSWTYYEMYMEAEINRAMELSRFTSPPKECHIDSMGYFEQIVYKVTRSVTSNDVCKDYYILTSTTTFESINPALVVIETLTRLVMQPLSTVCEKLGGGLTTLYNSIPWPLDVILFPIALVFIFTLLVFCACRALGLNFNVNILHLINFSIGSEQTSSSPRSEHRDQVPSIKMDDITVMANALRDMQMHQITNIQTQNVQRLLEQCERIINHGLNKSTEHRMIEGSLETQSSSTGPPRRGEGDNVKSKSNDVIACEAIDNDDDAFEQNDENVDSSNLGESQKKTVTSIDKARKRILTEKVARNLMESISDMEDRLEKANRTIDEKLSQITANSTNGVDH